MARRVGVGSRAAPGREHRWTQFGQQLLLVVAAYGAYRLVRILTETDRSRAFRHAKVLLSFEQRFDLDWERGSQALILGSNTWIDVFNFVYTWLFWPVVIGTLLLLYLRDRYRYQLYRNALFVSGAAGLLVFALFPVAPPRMLDGFIDTIHLGGQGGWAHPNSFTNEYAAMPSFHVGWIVLAGAALMPLVRRPVLRLLFLLPGGLMTFTVMATANHYVVDVLAGIALALSGLGVAYALHRRRCRRLLVAGEAPAEGHPERSPVKLIQLCRR
jgi:hypothetical protein